jgi:O-antigen/teichoic acid export membrane protein
VTDAVDLDHRIVRSSAWVALSYGGRSLLGMATTVVLAHLLAPAAFGLFAVASVVLLVIDTVQHGGVGAAIIFRQRRHGDSEDASAFAFSLASSVAFALAAVAVAPYFASLLDTPRSAAVLQALAPIVILRGAAVVPGAVLERRLDFRGRAKAELAAGVVQVGVSVGLALAGAGVWSLVGGQLAANAAQTAVLWTLVDWRPRRRDVRISVIRELVAYGRFVTLGNLLALVNGALDTAVVARILGSQALGYYTVGYKLADMPTNVIGYVVGRVMFPAYARVQHDRAAFRRAFLQNIERVALLVLPASVLLVAAAGPIVDVLLGARWEPVVTPLRVLAIYGVLRGFAAPCGSVFQAAGRPQLVAIWGLPHALLVVPLLIVFSHRWGVVGAAAAVTAAFAASALPAFVSAVRLLGVGGRELARTLARPAACSAVLAAALACLRFPVADLPAAAALALAVAVGTAVYVAAVACLARGAITPVVAGLRSRT